MKALFIVCLLVFAGIELKAQHNLVVVIKKQNGQPLEASSAVNTKLKISFIANDSGIVILTNIPAGKFDFEFSHVGYKDGEKEISFPCTTDTLQIILEENTEELENVTVSSTRSNRSIKNTPTRVEVISDEEIHEEAEMRPGDIRMLLAESTGIQTQQTSATSANASIRIQGLDGRYTQILKDGFPLYAGAATGLGLLQTPPLDLRQVEIIKGSSSTLYGGGAIAGLINLISKVPLTARELNFHFNITSAGGLDINSFYGQRFKKTGVTLFLSRNTNTAFDPANISFTAIPQFERYTINPKIFFYFNDKTTLNFGVNTTFENRLGGNINYIKGRGDSINSYFEKNKTKRLSTQLMFDHIINETSNLKIKNSISFFARSIASRGYNFKGTQYSTFSEATYVHKKNTSDWVMGLNILTDHFTEQKIIAIPVRNYDQNTLGIFFQNIWNAAEWLTIETGLRGDYVSGYGAAILPRISALIKLAPSLTSRVGGGFGYKAPNIFTEESEKILYKDVLPVSRSINKLEKSYGLNGDINYKTSFGKITLSLNQFFFYTFLKDPLFLFPLTNGLSAFQNIHGHINTKGTETNIKIGYNELSLYIGYTFTDARVNNNGNIYQNPLTPKHRLNGALVYEIENKWKFGSELYYFSKQKLTDNTFGRGYWLSGLVAEKLWENFSLYINFENFGDVRQTKFENIYSGTITNPVFKDIYAPLEGFVVNGGIKLRL